MNSLITNLLIVLNTLNTAAILIPNGGSVGNCGCAISQPCPPPPSCSPQVPPQPRSCSGIAARSSGRTLSGIEINPANLGEKEALIAVASKEIRRNPTKIADPRTRTNYPHQVHSGAMMMNDDGEISISSAEPPIQQSSAAIAEEVTSVVDGGENEQSKCNSQVLKKLMLENMSEASSNESKRSINAAAEHKFGGIIDVVCSRGQFSYVYSSSLFCETSKGEMTCIAFRQTS